MKRKLYAEIELDEDVMSNVEGCNAAPIDYTENKLRLLNPLGINLVNAVIADDDDEDEIARYCNYLMDFAMNALSREDIIAVFPLQYYDWCALYSERKNA